MLSIQPGPPRSGRRARSWSASASRCKPKRVKYLVPHGEIMNNLHARSVFFVKDAERSLRFYTETLGFSLEWNHQEQGRAFVFEVSLLGFQLILNQTEAETENRAGHGRVFIGLDDDQAGAFREHIRAKRIQTEVVSW